MKKLTANIKFFFLFSLLIFLFASCQSSPKIPEFTFNLEEGAYAPVNPGGSVYIFADVKQALPIIELLPVEELNANQTKKMLSMTDNIAAALYPQDSENHFQLAALGNYPTSGAKLAFSFDFNWRKQRMKSGGFFWYSKKSGLSIAMDANHAFVLSSAENNPIEPVTTEPGTLLPQGFAAFARGSPLSCWLNNPGPMINKMLKDARVPIQIPVQEIYLNFSIIKLKDPDDKDSTALYQALVRFRFENPSQARGMATLLAFTGFKPDNSNPSSILLSRLFENPPSVNERNLDLKTSNLSESELALLFELISLQ